MTPRRFAVIGDPVAHSKSPAMHMAAFRALGLPHTYEAMRAAAAELPGIVDALREGRLDGLNVTVPHKRAVLALVDDVAAPDLAAANTLVRTAEGRIVAHNTDVPALAEELRLLAGPAAPWASRRTLVLGSGGAALAAVSALRSLGARDVAVRARRPGAADVQPWRPSPDREGQTLAVVQATSAGMIGADPGEAVAGVVAWEALPPDAVALDLVYAPPETPFLRAAAARGLRRANGLGMLARQGALAFALWLGVEAPLGIMRAALET
ncbi:MAG: shikimate dehydrogenase [Polyangiaceae bacterium]